MSYAIVVHEAETGFAVVISAGVAFTAEPISPDSVLVERVPRARTNVVFHGTDTEPWVIVESVDEVANLLDARRST